MNMSTPIFQTVSLIHFTKRTFNTLCVVCRNDARKRCLYLLSSIRIIFMAFGIIFLGNPLPRGTQKMTLRHNFGQIIRTTSNLIEILFKFINTSPIHKFRMHSIHTEVLVQQQQQQRFDRFHFISLSLAPATNDDEKYERTKWDIIFMKILCKLSETICSNSSAHFLVSFFPQIWSKTNNNNLQLNESDWLKTAAKQFVYACVCVLDCSWREKVRAWKKLKQIFKLLDVASTS